MFYKTVLFSMFFFFAYFSNEAPFLNDTVAVACGSAAFTTPFAPQKNV